MHAAEPREHGTRRGVHAAIQAVSSGPRCRHAACLLRAPRLPLSLARALDPPARPQAVRRSQSLILLASAGDEDEEPNDVVDRGEPKKKKKKNRANEEGEGRHSCLVRRLRNEISLGDLPS